jgi:hypothetical protein
MSDVDRPDCPECKEPLSFVRNIDPSEVAHEGTVSTDASTMPHASSLWKCERENTHWRYFINGRLPRVDEMSELLRQKE